MDQETVDAIIERANAKTRELISEATDQLASEGHGAERNRETVLERAVSNSALEIAHLEEHGPDDPDELRRFVAQAARRARSESET